MLNLLSAFFIISLILSSIVSSGVLFLASVVLLLLYLFFFIADLKDLNKDLKNRDYSNPDKILNAVPTYTRIVDTIRQKIYLRRSELIDNLNEEKLLFSAKEADAQILKYREKVSAIISNGTNFLEELTNFLHEIANGGAAAIVSLSDGKVVDLYINIKEVDAFKDVFRDIGNEIAHKNFDLLGYKQVSECGLIGERLESFGFKSFLLKVAKFQEGQSYLIWNGYRQRKGPKFNSMKNIDYFVSAVETELLASSRVHMLNKELQGKTEEKLSDTQFISHISHDIRSPLHNIKSILSILDEDWELSSDPDSKDLIQVAKNNIETADDLVTSLLDYSKMSQGALKAQKTVFNLAALVKSVVSDFTYTARQKGLELQVLGPEVLTIEGDKSHLKRIMQNLVSNALKYTDKGHVQVIISPTNNRQVGVKVMDTGRGMSGEEVNKLFTPFERFHKDMAEGVGLGLVLTKVLVELNDGKIKVASTKGQGTTFTIVLPATAKEVSFIEKQREEFETLNHSLSYPSNVITTNKFKKDRKKILILDDDIEYLKSLETNLKAYNYDVFQCYSLEQAKSIFNYEQPDYIVSDLDVPNGGGEQLLNYINENTYVNSQVIILSGNTANGVRERLIKLGAKDVLSKPVDVASLIESFEESNEEKESLVI